MPELRTRAIREVSVAPDFEDLSRGMPRQQPTTEELYLCGECGMVLIERRSASKTEDGLLRCTNCGTLNDLELWLPRVARAVLQRCPRCGRECRHPDQPVCGSCWWS